MMGTDESKQKKGSVGLPSAELNFPFSCSDIEFIHSGMKRVCVCVWPVAKKTTAHVLIGKYLLSSGVRLLLVNGVGIPKTCVPVLCFLGRRLKILTDK